MRLLLIALLSMLLIGTAFATPPVILDFVGGIQAKPAKACLIAINESPCQLKNLLTAYQQCVKNVLANTPDCRQARTFFRLTSGGVFSRIRYYHHIDVILAKYVYIADQGSGYFLVMANGQFFSLPLDLPKKALQQAPGYLALSKRYSHLDTWQILAFPKDQYLANGRYRLQFTQQLKDGCNACAIAGTAQVAYDFSPDGKIFYGTTILGLFPLSH